MAFWSESPPAWTESLYVLGLVSPAKPCFMRLLVPERLLVPGSFDHIQDVFPNGRRQRRPSVDHLLQIGVLPTGRQVKIPENATFCAGYCAAAAGLFL